MIPADPVTTYLNARYRPDVAADLLAAAQPLMAIAWDEGAAATFSDPTGLSLRDLTNPYRSQA